MKQRMQCKDIDDQHVIDLAEVVHRTFMGSGVIGALMAEDVPYKVAYTKVMRLVYRGYLDYGVSPNFAWPTGKQLPQAREPKVKDSGDQ